MNRTLVKLASYPAPARLAIFVGLLLLIWSLPAIFIYWLLDDRWASILAPLILYVEFLWLTGWWGRSVYREAHTLRRYGLVWTLSNARYLIQGLAIGVGSLLSMFVLQSLLGWVTWQAPTGLGWFALGRVAGEGLLVAVGVGFAEEVLFRGWLLDELERDYSPSTALYVSSAIFALLHFIKPLAVILKTFPQFVGLLLLGIALVWAKRAARGQLGLAIGLHAGLVWGYYLVNVGQLVAYTDQVPQWVTGIDRNPLAGLIGLGCLGAIALGMQRWAARVVVRND